MKIPISFRCVECNAKVQASIGVEDSSMEVTGSCGHDYSGFFDLGFTRGPRILRRANHELLQQKDFSMAIVVSAMAFEGELSRLHHKWEGISALLEMTDLTDDALDELLRRYGNIRKKIEHVCRLMHPAGIDKFSMQHPELRTTIPEGFPSLRIGSLAEDFQRHLFWPRNRILHLGYGGFTREDAAKCFQRATIGLRILQLLDDYKRAAM